MKIGTTVAVTLGVMATLPLGVAAAGDGGSPGRSGQAPGQVKKQDEQQAPAAQAEQRHEAKAQAKAEAKAQGETKGQAKHEDRGQANGQAKAKGETKSEAKGKAKANGQVKSKPKAKAGHGAKPQHSSGSTHAKAGKTTICHATGSATNPYVTITISDNALAAHRRHQDGRDIIPAPAGGCPKKPGGDHHGGDHHHGDHHHGDYGHGGNGDGGHGKVTICHATGSATNPYVEITIAEAAVQAHREHQNGEDIIPAPTGGCPKAGGGGTPWESGGGSTPGGTTPGGTTTGGVVTVGGTTPAGSTPTESAPLSGYTSPTPQGASGPAVLGATESSPAGTSPTGAAGPQVLGESESSGVAPASETGSLSEGSLPFTGMDLALAAMIAAALLLTGVAIRRAATHR
jgi:hypothetical protein